MLLHIKLVTKSIYLLNKYTPYVLIKLPYKVALNLFTFFIPKSLVVLTRHSFSLDKLTFPLSDIDITIAIQNEKDLDYKLLSKISLLKKIILPIGEISFIYNDDFKILKSTINPLEWQRAPEVASYFNYHRIPITNADYIVYLCRMYLSDIRNLYFNFKNRENKWQYHLEQIETDVKFSNFKNSLEFISFVGSLILERYAQEGVGEYFINLTQYQFGLLKHKRRSHLKFMILYDFKYWVESSIYNNDFELELELIDDFSKQEKEIILKQIQWELWGIYTQLPISKNLHLIKKHLETLRLVLSYLDINTAIFVDNQFNVILSRANFLNSYKQ